MDAFFGEETGRGEVDGADGVWVVDSIDGTQPFLGGMGSWCVSIGFVAGGRPRTGFVTSPARRETFVGRLGHGATLNGAPIEVSKASRLDQGIVGIGYSARDEVDAFLPRFERLLRTGAMFYREESGALTLCSVACGQLLGYVEHHMNSYDCLDALAVIEVEDGSVCDFLAGDALMKGNSVVAEAPTVYPSLVALLDRPILPNLAPSST